MSCKPYYRILNHKMSMLLLLLCSISFTLHAHALECGLGKHLEDDNVKNAFQNCIANWTVVTVEKPIEEPTNSTTEGTPSSTADPNNKNVTTSNANSTEKTVTKRSVNNEAQKNDENGNADSSKCVVYCILHSMELIDNQGYPDHHRIADTLTKYADERELKDFFQDSTDECFQLQNQDKPEVCQYSISLVSCLAEKARLNCGDWNFYSLSFA